MYATDASIKRRDCVVFVHGIFGSGTDTWLNSNASFSALLAADPEFSRNIDVFVFEYYTPEFGNAASIVALADQLRGSLEDHHVFASHEHVMFLAHSMGGLVVRQFLLTNRTLLPRVPMLYFAATPTNGSELAVVGHQISTNPQLRGMVPIEGNDLLQSIQSSWLGWPDARKVPSYCAYELLPTMTVMVVSMGSATALCNQPLDPMTANHIEIVKPSSRDDPRYTRFANALRTALQLSGDSSASGGPQTAEFREPQPDDLIGDAQPSSTDALVELSTSFVDHYADRATIVTHMTVQRVVRVHAAKSDADLTFVGIGDETLLPTVAELMNAAERPDVFDVLRSAIAAKRPISVAGAWRLWFEHPGSEAQLQGAEFGEPSSTNPPHFLELHPVVNIGDLDVADTVKTIDGFAPHDAATAFAAIRQRQVTISRAVAGRVRLTMKPIGYNYIDVAVKVEGPPTSLKDGHAVRAALNGADGQQLASGIRIVSVERTDVDKTFAHVKAGDQLRLLSIPRVSLRALQTLADGTHSLPYELVAVSASKSTEESLAEPPWQGIASRVQKEYFSVTDLRKSSAFLCTRVSDQTTRIWEWHWGQYAAPEEGMTCRQDVEGLQKGGNEVLKQIRVAVLYRRNKGHWDFLRVEYHPSGSEH